ncbi:MAG: iron complex outermembrane recepter protein [Methyloprofundus sp.]|nr:MAG: iron complex outermembrane recepter protein [Methyloprofundus sp.]
MKTKLNIAIATALALPTMVYAETEQLATIVVEGSANRPGAMAIAPDSSGFKDTAALLERVPGANVNRNGPLTAIPQYRGMYGNRVNVEVNGANIKEAGPNSMDTPLSHIPAVLTESLKVYLGIAPISSGIETEGGTMEVKTKSGNFAASEGEIESDGALSSGYSSVDNGYFVSGFSSLANENHKLHFGMSKEEGNDYKYNERDNKKVVPTSYDRQAIIAGYDFQANGHELSLNYTNNYTRNSGTPALPMDIVYIKSSIYNADYNWDLGQGYELKTKFFYQNSDHLMDNHSLRMAMMANGAPRLMNNQTNVQGGGWDIQFLMPLFSGEFKTGFTGDIAYHNSDVTMNMAMKPGAMPMNMNVQNFNDATRSRYSFFGEWKGDINDALSTELGLRYTYTTADTDNVSTSNMGLKSAAAKFNSKGHHKDFNNVDLTAILRYAMSEELNFEIGFARKNRAPSYQELYLWAPSQATGGLADGRTYVGNLDLSSETAYQFELGMEWHTGALYFAPRAYYHYINNYIQGTPSALNKPQPSCPTGSMSCLVLQFNNIEAQIYGVDVEGGYEFTDWLRFDAGLNYVRGQRLDGPKGNLYRIAPLNGRTQLTFNNWGFTASVEGIYYAAQDKVASYNNERTTPSYQIMNLRASYEAFDGLVIGTGIENVIDATNYNHLGGYYAPMSDPANGLTQGQRIPMQGRNYYVTLAYQW